MRGKPHRAEHVRRLERARGAGRPGRYRYAFEIQRDEQALGFDAIEADVRRVRDTQVPRAVDVRPRDAGEDARLQTIAQRRQAPGLGRKLLEREVSGRAESRDAWHILRARPP